MADDRPDLTPDPATRSPVGAPFAAPAAPVSELARLYETDVLAWSEQQAKTLRGRLCAPGLLDWDNLAEEIEDVGKSEYWACESQVENIVEHLLKLEFVASPRDVPHWRGEVRTFRNTLRKRLTPTVLKRLNETLDEVQRPIIKALEDRELPGFGEAQAAVAYNRLYTWAQIVDAEWLPNSRAEPGAATGAG